MMALCGIDVTRIMSPSSMPGRFIDYWHLRAIGVQLVGQILGRKCCGEKEGSWHM